MKKKQISIRKLSLSKKTISFLDSQSSAQIVGGSDPYQNGTASCPCGGSVGTYTGHTYTCPPPPAGSWSCYCPVNDGFPVSSDYGGGASGEGSGSDGGGNATTWLSGVYTC